MSSSEEHSKELAEIQSRLDHPYSCLKPGSPWGYAVVRSVYGPGTDAPWKRILQLLDDNARHTCEFYSNAGSLYDRHVLAPIEDAGRLATASSHTVRSVFEQWAAAEMQAWAVRPHEPRGSDELFGTRYNFCLYFDRVCLESLEHEQPRPVIKLLKKNWLSGPLDASGPPEPWEDGVTDKEEEDVGWMYIDASSYVETYGLLDDPYWWHNLYVRAPAENLFSLRPRRKGDL